MVLETLISHANEVQVEGGVHGYGGGLLLIYLGDDDFNSILGSGGCLFLWLPSSFFCISAI